MSRVEKYRDIDVNRALDSIYDLVLANRPGVVEEIRKVLHQLYTNGAGWGEQDAYSEAAREIRDLEYERDMERAYW